MAAPSLGRKFGYLPKLEPLRNLAPIAGGAVLAVALE